MFRIPLNLIHSNLVKGSPEVEVIVLHAGSVLSPVSIDVGFPHPPAAPHSVKSLAVRRERAAPITTSRSSTTATIYNTTILQTTNYKLQYYKRRRRLLWTDVPHVYKIQVLTSTLVTNTRKLENGPTS